MEQVAVVPPRAVAPAESAGPIHYLIRAAEDILAGFWSDVSLQEEAQRRCDTLALLTQVGLVDDAAAYLREILALKQKDNLTSALAAAESLGLALQPLDWVEPTYFHSGLHNVGWRTHKEIKVRAYLFGKVGPIIARHSYEIREAGIFRKHILSRRDTLHSSLRVPIEAMRQALLLGRVPNVDEIAVFERAQSPDPILAVLVADRWFRVYQWD